MAAVEGSYRSMLQGMSQQPPQERGEGQCELQVNMTSDPVLDLGKRPPTFLVSSVLDGTATRNDKFYNYDRGDNEEYLIQFHSSGIKVVDTATGTDIPVKGYAEFGSYLNTSNRRNNLHVSTVGDLTIVANSKVEVAVTNAVGLGSTTQTIEIKGSAWATNYVVEATSVSDSKPHTIEYQTPKGIGKVGAPGDPVDPDLDDSKLLHTDIAQQLTDKLNQIIPGSATRHGTIIEVAQHLVRLTKVDDGKKGVYIAMADGSITDLSDLPSTSPHLRVIEVAPEVNTSGDGNYYLQFVSDPVANYGSGKWVESPKIGIPTTLDRATMPHALIRLQEPDGSIYFQFTDLVNKDYPNFTGTYNVPAYGMREVGDDKTNPIPSFVGQTISFVGLFQERLYMLSGEQVVFSTATDYFDFFYQSALTVNDSDPLDFSASTNKTNTLKYGTTHDGDLLLFSNNSQFLIQGGKPLTPNTANMTAITFFESNSSSLPISAGRSIYFPISYGEYNGVRELQTDLVSATRDAPAVTAHVSKLIKGDIIKMSGNNEAGFMAMSTDTFDNKVFVYEYLWRGNERIQSSWSYWEVDDDSSVIYHFTDKTRFFIVAQNNVTSKVYLTVMELEDFKFTSFGFNVYLDRLVELTTTADQVDAPYTHKDMVFVQGEGCPYPGMLANKYSNPAYTGDHETVTLDQDMKGGKVYMGIPYNSVYVPTRPYVKDSKGAAITTGAFTISKYRLSYVDTGYVSSTIVSKYDTANTVGRMSGRIVGELSNRVGVTPIVSGVVNIPMLHSPDNADMTLHSDDYRPMRFVDIEWEGQFSKNKRRL